MCVLSCARQGWEIFTGLLEKSIDNCLQTVAQYRTGPGIRAEHYLTFCANLFSGLNTIIVDATVAHAEVKLP